MWFDEEIISGHRLGSVKQRRKTPTLNLRKRKSRKKDPRRLHRVAVIGILPVIVAGLGLLGWYGVRGLGRLLFTGNDRFTITRLQIRDDGAAAHDFFRGEKKIREGTNMFAFDVETLCEEFLLRAPSYRAVKITRRLPNVLTVEVSPRSPLVRIPLGWQTAVVADREGTVFSTAEKVSHLPVVSGYPGDNPQPGTKVSGLAVAAVQLVDVCGNPALGLFVEEVDLGNKGHVVVIARYGGRRRRLSLVWEGMGGRSPESRLNLLKKLGRWVQVMQTDEGIEKTSFDGTYPDRIYAI